jgi:ssRNA-specific RNase YbeY (16S rRNA maturation enzyme)
MSALIWEQLEKLVLGELEFSLRFWEPEHNQQQHDFYRHVSA